MDPVRTHFGLQGAEHLGGGAESDVYAMDDDRVLRVFKRPVDVEERVVLLDELASGSLPFAIPEVLDHGAVGGVTWSIERRIPGRSLDQYLLTLEGADRTKVLRNYADAALALSKLDGTKPWFGFVMRPQWARAPTWTAALIAAATKFARRAAVRLVDDIPELDHLLDRFAVEAAAIEDVDPGMVHGDYFPGNVMVGDDLSVTGVVDFNVFVMHGDRRLDLVSAVMFAETPRAWSRAGDSSIVEAHVLGADATVGSVLDLYKVYLALQFCLVKEFDVDVYRWFLQILCDWMKD
jgi:aminoglycoside phosphotransferase (APT) family kinase protein